MPNLKRPRTEAVNPRFGYPDRTHGPITSEYTALTIVQSTRPTSDHDITQLDGNSVLTLDYGGVGHRQNKEMPWKEMYSGEKRQKP